MFLFYVSFLCSQTSSSTPGTPVSQRKDRYKDALSPATADIASAPSTPGTQRIKREIQITSGSSCQPSSLSSEHASKQRRSRTGSLTKDTGSSVTKKQNKQSKHARNSTNTSESKTQKALTVSDLKKEIRKGHKIKKKLKK